MLNLRRIPVFFTLAAYIAASVMAAMHAGEHWHHHHAAAVKTSDETQPACDCGHHHHGNTTGEQSGDHQNPHPHHHDEDDCHVCQFLAQKPLPVACVFIVGVGRLVEVRRLTQPPRPDAAPPALPFSRAPPEVA